MNLRFDSRSPIYMQVVNKLKEEIISGEFTPGDKILSVRDFAYTLKVNPNTIQRALTNLEEEGFIITKRTSGKFVTEDLVFIKQKKKELASLKALEYFKNMENLGFTKEESLLNITKEGEK
ncbi:MAG: GntR family transcriptional regulator [Bacilli bacterium]